MADEIIHEAVDTWEEHEFHDEWDPKCSECYKLCNKCLGRGYITKTEWVGTDTSYDVEIPCECNDND